MLNSVRGAGIVHDVEGQARPPQRDDVARHVAESSDIGTIVR